MFESTISSGDQSSGRGGVRVGVVEEGYGWGSSARGTGWGW